MKTILVLLMGFLATGFLVSSSSGDDEKNPQTLSDKEVATIAQQLNLDMSGIYQVSSPITKDQQKAAENEVAQAMKSLDTYSAKADQALSHLIVAASWALERRGYHAEAVQMRSEYQERYQRGIHEYALGIVPVDIGDHAPLSQWLETQYQKLAKLLGPTLMRALKLEDIRILNYSIPVVFHPNGYKGDKWDMLDYRDHFAGTRTKLFYPLTEHDGFAGVVSYWVVWAVCTGATWGMGAIPFICSPIAELSDFAIEKWVAPKMSDAIFCKVTNNGPGCLTQ